MSLSLLPLCLSLATSEPPVATWVMFRDKGLDPAETAAAIRDLESSYNARAIARRGLRRSSPGLFDERDVAVHAPYVDRVLATGADRRVVSRWLNAVSVEATESELARIRALPCVLEVRPVAGLDVPEPVQLDMIDGLSHGFYGFAEEQLTQINVAALHDAGYTGEGVIVGVLDTGFRRRHEAFNHPDHPLDVLAEHDFVDNDGNTDEEAGERADQADHGTLILGTLGSYQPDMLVGAAYDASFVLCKVETVEFERAPEEDWFAAGLELIESLGGDVATSSVVAYWYGQSDMDGQTTVMARAVNTATDNGVHVCQGVGNNQHDANPNTSSMLTPADAFEVIAVGAVESDDDIAWFSSDGPTQDGRVKPEVLARGLNTYTVPARGTTGVATASGTSLATPLAAGAVACLVQAHPEWTVAQMRNALFRTADYFVANGTHDPLFVHGYGIIDAFAALSYCPADISGDGTVDTQDVLAFLNAWNAGAPAGDFDGNGIWNTLDVLAFLTAWVDGCD